MSEMPVLQDYGFLFPASHRDYCCEMADCHEAVVEHEGRFFITFGHAGFNSPANNARGYNSAKIARAAIRHYSRPRN